MTSYNLGPKLFLAHFTVALVAILTFVFVSFAMPSLFGNLLGARGDGGRRGCQPLRDRQDSRSDQARASSHEAYLRRQLRRAGACCRGRRTRGALGELQRHGGRPRRAREESQEFISDVSHELNTPLSTLQGYVEGLLDGVIYPTEETWGLMYAETERMRRLVDDLRQLSSAEAGRLALDIGPFPPEEPIRLAAEGMRPLFTEKGCACAVRSRNLANGAGRRRPVVQVLTNLLSNALRHTPAGGLVVVGVKAQEEGVLFEVSDTGVGISPEHLPRIFERFYRIEKSRSREGRFRVGLAICRALVEAMGGSISAESAGAGRGPLSPSFCQPLAGNLDESLILS